MAQDSKTYRKSELQISEISTSSEKLSGRAGLALFVWRLKIKQPEIIELGIDTPVGSQR